MKRPDGSRSPTRKQLAKLAINYSKQMMEDKQLDRPNSKRSRDLKRTQANLTSQKGSLLATKSVGPRDEVYIDQDHRDLKLHKLTHLMEVEVAKGEIDGELDFKQENIEKAYTGYPQFMQRRGSLKPGTPERDRTSSVDSQGRPVKPLIEDLKEALSKAKEVDSVETSQLNESSEVTSFRHEAPAAIPAGLSSPQTKISLEEKLYYLELKHIPEYTESPMKERFDFHQRKSKEIRRVQYATYLDKSKNKPVLHKKSTLRDLFTEAPKMVTRREGSREIIKKEERMEIFFSNLPKMTGDKGNIDELKRGLPSRQPAIEDAGLSFSFVRNPENLTDNKKPAYGRSYTAAPGYQNQRRSRQDRARDSLQEGPAARIVNSELDPSNQSEGYKSIQSSHGYQSEDEVIYGDRPRTTENFHRQDPLHPRKSSRDQQGRPSGSQVNKDPTNSKAPPGAQNQRQSDIASSDRRGSRITHSNISDDPRSAHEDPARPLGDSKASFEDVHNNLNQRPVALFSGDGDNLADHLVPPIILEFEVGDPCQVDEVDRSMARGDTLGGDDDEPDESAILEPGQADDPDEDDHHDSYLSMHDSEPEEEVELKANVADNPDEHSRSHRSLHDNLSEEPEPASEEEILEPIKLFGPWLGSKRLDYVYIDKIYLRPRQIPEPCFATQILEFARKAIDRQRTIPAKNLVRAEPSPDKYSKKVENAYIKRVYERPAIEPSPQRVERSLDRTYIYNVRSLARAEPSPERYIKREDQTYISRIYQLPKLEPSPEKYAKKEDSTYVHRVYNRKVVEPLNQRIEKSVERTYAEKINVPVRPEPSPERYAKKEDSTYVKRVYNRQAVPPLEKRTEQSIERTYVHKVKDLCRAEPSPERYLKHEDSTYVKRVYQRHAAPPLNERIEKSLERAYARKVYDLPRAEPSPERYHKKEEFIYVTKVYKRIKNPPAPAFMMKKIETWSIQRVYIRKRILPYLATGKFETFSLVRTVLWEPEEETASQRSANDGGYNDAASVYSEVKSAGHSSKGSQRGANDSRVFQDDHPSQDEEEEPQLVYVYPAGEETESTRADKEADQMREDSDQDNQSEDSIDRYGRTAPYQKFPVWVLTPTENIPAQISSPDGFIVDKETGKLEIRAGDNVILEPAELDRTDLTSSKVPTTFDPITDKIRKPDPQRDPQECDFVVKNPVNSERIPVAVELRPRKLAIPNTNCTLFDPHKKELGRAVLTLVEMTKAIDPETEERDEVYIPRLIHNAFLLDERDKVLDVLVKEEIQGGSVFLPESVVQSIVNPMNPQNSKLFGKTESGKLERAGHRPSKLVESTLLEPTYSKPSAQLKGLSRSAIHTTHVKPELGTVKETDYPIILKRSPDNCTQERVVREEIAVIANIPVRILTLDPNRSTLHSSKAKLATVGVEPASESRDTSQIVRRTQPELVFIPLDPNFKVIKSKILDEEPASAICNNGEDYRGSILVENVTDKKTGDKQVEVFILIDPDLKQSQIGADDKPNYVQVDLDDNTKKDLKEYADLKEGINKLVKPEPPKRKEVPSPKRHLALDQLDLRLVDNKGRELRVNILEKGSAPEDPDESIVENYENVYNSEDLYYQLEYGGKQIEPSQVQKPSPKSMRQQGKTSILFSRQKDPRGSGDGRSPAKYSGVSDKDSRVSSSRAAGYTPSGSKTTLPVVGGAPKPTVLKYSKPSEPVRRQGHSAPRSKSPRSYAEQLATLRTRAARSIALYWRYSRLKPVLRAIFGQKYGPARLKFVQAKKTSLFKGFLLSWLAGSAEFRAADLAKAAEGYLSTTAKTK